MGGMPVAELQSTAARMLAALLKHLLPFCPFVVTFLVRNQFIILRVIAYFACIRRVLDTDRRAVPVGVRVVIQPFARVQRDKLPGLEVRSSPHEEVCICKTKFWIIRQLLTSVRVL